MNHELAAPSTAVSTPPVEPSGNDVMRASEGLPAVFVNLLERRYLNTINSAPWDMAPQPFDNAPPLLREVLALGNPRHKGEWGAAMGHVLTGCHEPGSGLVVTLFGDGQRPHLYLGARRLTGGGGRNAEDFLKNEEGAFKAYFNGLTLSERACALNREEMPALAEFLESARSLAAVTGIPSWRRSAADMPLEFQSLDQLVKAVGQRRYAVMIVAEPVQAEEIDAAIDVCRKLIGFVHAFASVTKSQGSNQSMATQRPDESAPQGRMRLSTWGELGVGLAGTVVGLVGGPGTVVNPIVLFGGINGLLRAFDSMQMQGEKQQERERERVTDTEGTSQSLSASFIDANAEACEKMLRQYLARIEQARSNGWWRTGVYLAAEDPAVLATVGGALRSLGAGETTSLDPIRLLPVPEETVRDAMTVGRLLALRPPAGNPGHPFGESFDILGTCLTSEELAIFVNLPRTEIPGIPMRDLSEFCLSTAPCPEPSIAFASLRDSLGRDLSPVRISAKTLNRHVLVCGTTGYGKTNTCWRLLLETYRGLGVPFLVIEPAKAEYHRLAQFPELRNELNIYNVGGGNGVPLRLNPFDWVKGIPLLRHINILKAIFSASVFPTGEDSPFPYIVESALYEIYLERGWNLNTSENADLPGYHRQESLDRSALLPTLDEFARKAEEVLRRRGYDAPTEQRLLGALNVRMRSLVTGTKGISLNTRRSTWLEHLFKGPTVIELSNLGNAEEKAFVMALLFSLLYEQAEMRTKERPHDLAESLQHVTLIEEAHCLLKATGGSGSRRFSDPAAKAVDMFCDMLAEMRAYGEGFIIADQIPTKLAPEILKNTGLKIIHRLSDPAERKVAGDCVNLSDWQLRHLNNLTEGLAVTHFEEATEPVLCYVPLLKTSAPKMSQADLGELAQKQVDRAKLYMKRHSGCIECQKPCTYLDTLDTASDNYAFQHAPLPGSDRRADAAAKAARGSMPAPVSLLEVTSSTADLTAKLGEKLLPTLRALLRDDRDAARSHFDAWLNLAGRLVRGLKTADGTPDLGVAYCTATQAAYHLLGELARNRGLAVYSSRTPQPADLLGRDRAAATLGTLFNAWLSGALALAANGAIADLRNAQLFQPLPQFQDNPHCARCESKCRLLAFTSPFAQAVLAQARQPAPAIPAAARSARGHALADLVTKAVENAPGGEADRAGVVTCLRAQVHLAGLLDGADDASGELDGQLAALAARTGKEPA